jgi:hypothetical protein
MKYASKAISARPAQFTYETRDCSVRALRVALGCSYEEAHRALKTTGRVDRRGTYNATMRDASAVFGFKPISPTASGMSERPTLAQFVRAHRYGRYVIRVHVHFIALVHGTVHDNLRTGPRTRVIAAWGQS